MAKRRIKPTVGDEIVETGKEISRAGYSPKSGQLAGQSFSSRSAYEKALYQSYGFQNRAQFREYTRNPNTRTSISRASRQDRPNVYKALGSLYQEKQETGRKADFRDVSPRGDLARYLVRIGRRDPDADYNVGETPRR